MFNLFTCVFINDTKLCHLCVKTCKIRFCALLFYKICCYLQRQLNVQVILIGSVSQMYVTRVQTMSVTADIVIAKYLTSGRLLSSNRIWLETPLKWHIFAVTYSACKKSIPRLLTIIL